MEVKGGFSGSWAFCVRLDSLLRVEERGGGWWDPREGDVGATHSCQQESKTVPLPEGKFFMLPG